MTEDIHWLRQQHDQFDREVQRGRFSFADCRENCDHAAAVWNDNCAREIRQRYLDPLSDEATASMTQLGIQQAAYVATALSLEGQHHEFFRTTEFSNQLDSHAREIHHLFHQIDSTLSHALSEMERASAHARAGDDWVAQATQAGAD